jgi:RNA recognition motif-containing protein
MKIYVGNLSFQTTADGIRALFAPHGEIEDVSVVTDRETGRSRGFGFVTMPQDSQAQAAIAAINGTELDGRALNVNEARPKAAGGGGGGGRGGNRGGSGGGGRDRW